VRRVNDVGSERLGIVEVRDDREVEVPVANLRVCAVAVGADLRNLRGDRGQRALENCELRGGGLGLPTKDDDVAEDGVLPLR